MQEQVFFSDSAVRVTSTEATFGQISVPVASIVSTRIEPVPPARSYLFFTGIVLLVLACLSSTMLRWLPASGDFDLSYFLLDLTRALMWIAGILSLLVWFQATRYLVKISGDFGEKYVVVARRFRYARKVAGAVSAAVEARAALPVHVKENAPG